MTLKGKEIWIISPESWGVSLFSKHYYALTLAESGNRVLFIQPSPAGPNPHPNIVLVHDSSYIIGTNQLPSALSKIIHRRQIKKWKRNYCSEPDIVWVFDDSQRKYLELYKPAKVIYHLMDLHAGKNIARSTQNADLCLGVTKGIVQEMKKHTSKAYHIAHGYVDYPEVPIDFPEVKEKYKAAFVGNLLIPFLHWPSIFKSIESNPNVHFFFIGSTGGGNLNPDDRHLTANHLKQIAEKSNVSLLGEMPPAEVQSFLNKCDLLFYSMVFPKNRGPVEDAHKILTYLGTGKPIVGTYLSAYEDNNDLIYFAESEDFLSDRIAEILENLEELSSLKLAEMRRGFALNHLYSEHLKRIEAIL